MYKLNIIFQLMTMCIKAEYFAYGKKNVVLELLQPLFSL